MGGETKQYGSGTHSQKCGREHLGQPHLGLAFTQTPSSPLGLLGPKLCGQASNPCEQSPQVILMPAAWDLLRINQNNLSVL